MAGHGRRMRIRSSRGSLCHYRLLMLLLLLLMLLRLLLLSLRVQGSCFDAILKTRGRLRHHGIAVSLALHADGVVGPTCTGRLDCPCWIPGWLCFPLLPC